MDQAVASGSGVMRYTRSLLVFVIATVALAGCAPPSPPPPPPGEGSGFRPAQLKTLTIALQAEPASVHPIMGGEVGGSPAGHVNGALHHRLTNYDNKGNPIAQLASEIPSLEKGSWVLNEDRTMQTSYRLRPNVVWHDGHPFTARDVAFGWTIARDTQLPIASRD